MWCVRRRAGTIDRDRLAWRSMRASKYVEDRRGQHTAGSSAAAGPRGAQLGVGVLVVLGVLAVITGVGTQFAHTASLRCTCLLCCTRVCSPVA